MTKNTDKKEQDSMRRKMDLVFSVSGSGDEQLNVLVNALAYATISNDVEAASVIQHYCSCVLKLNEEVRNRKQEEDEDDEY